jgi:mRNA interferase MazF
VFVVVSRQTLIESRFSTVICAPIYSTHEGLSTQVAVGVAEGLKHDSSIHCDELVSLPKTALSNFAGALSPRKLVELKRAIRIAVDVEA